MDEARETEPSLIPIELGEAGGELEKTDSVVFRNRAERVSTICILCDDGPVVTCIASTGEIVIEGYIVDLDTH